MITRRRTARSASAAEHAAVVADVTALLEEARRTAARSVNAVMTATYWMIGRRVVEHDQRGKARAEYGSALLETLAKTLTRRFGRGFSADRLETRRLFYLAYPSIEISATLSRKSYVAALAGQFPLSWSHYVLLLRRAPTVAARTFYETETRRGGWTVRQLERQIEAQFYQRTLLSKKKVAMLQKEATPLPTDTSTPEEEVKDPFVLEFLALKDEYSESELEDGLIAQLETFLLELGADFAFIGRQRASARWLGMVPRGSAFLSSTPSLPRGHRSQGGSIYPR